MRHSLYAVIFVSCVFASAPAFAQQQPTVEGSFDTYACMHKQLKLGDDECLTLKDTRWHIVEKPDTAHELAFEIELRPDNTVLSTHLEATWPQNDGWRVEDNTLILHFSSKRYAFQIQKHKDGVLSGEAFELDEQLETYVFQAARPKKVYKNAAKTLAIYERLVTALHPMTTSSVKKNRAVLERMEALTAELKKTDCSTIATTLQRHAKKGAPSLAAELKDSQGFEGLDDFTNPLDPSTSTEDHLADAHHIEINKRLVASHKVMFAVVRQCSKRSNVVAGFDAFVSAIEAR